jgi:hypothetical protein
MKNVIESKDESRFSRMVAAISRLKMIEVNRRENVRLKPSKKKTLDNVRDNVKIRDRTIVRGLSFVKVRFLISGVIDADLNLAGKQP